MDTAVAEHSPGVAAVYTPFNPLKLYRGLEQSEGGSSGEILSPLQDRKILNYGQMIGLVVADSFEQARDAAALIRTRYEVEDPVASWEKGMENSFTPPAVGEDKATTKIFAAGVQSIDDAIKGSSVVVDVTYTEPIYHHNPMEPHATTAVWQGDRLTIYDATQGVVARIVSTSRRFLGSTRIWFGYFVLLSAELSVAKARCGCFHRLLRQRLAHWVGRPFRGCPFHQQTRYDF